MNWHDPVVTRAVLHLPDGTELANGDITAEALRNDGAWMEHLNADGEVLDRYWLANLGGAPMPRRPKRPYSPRAHPQTQRPTGLSLVATAQHR